MNKFKYYFILLITTFSLFSCSKDDNTIEIAPPKEFAAQYAIDLTDIEDYLKNYYIEDVSPDVVTKITKIPTGGTQRSIWSYLDSPTFPKLLSKKVTRNDVSYKVYYMVLREGIGQAPTNTDDVLAAYKGEYLSKTKVADVETLGATFFEQVDNPQSFFALTSTIVGWGELFPEFKTGTYTENTDGSVSYSNFGAGIMFIPSGLGYFSQVKNSIPSYSPLVFSIKLYEINRADSDNDGIPNFQEDIDGDRYMRVLATGVVNPDDTDGDGIPNFLDTDDDGDGVSTRSEITVNGKLIPFAEIPSCDGNTTNPARIKRHLVKCN